jgi:hypothetical protein
MNTEALIRDLIVEDQFNTKYTKRQKSIFCKNMYTKISKFLKQQEEEIMDRLVQRYQRQEDELKETKRQLKQYRFAYEGLLKRNKFTILIDFIQSFINIMVIVYVYVSLYQWITTTMQTDQLPTSPQTV